MAEIRTRLPRDTDIEIWWQDEARIGQKNKITRRWAKRGTRPSAPKDQRTKSAYIFGAICPARGVGAALVLPRCNTQAMQWHLDEIATISSYDLKMRLLSQLSRKNCHIFSTGLSSGDLGGKSSSVMLGGINSLPVVCHPA